MPGTAIDMTEYLVLALVFMVATGFILYAAWWYSIEKFVFFKRKRLQHKLEQLQADVADAGEKAEE